MTCLKCDAPTAASLGVAEHEAAAGAVCVQHLAELLRERARWRCAGCGRRLLLAPDRPCAWCVLGRSVSEDITTLKLPVHVLRGAAYLAARDAVCKDTPDDEIEKNGSDSEEMDDE